MTLHHCGMLSQKHVSKSFHIFNIQDGTEVRKLQMPDENVNIKKSVFGIVLLCIWLNLDKIIYQIVHFLKWGDVIDPGKSEEQVIKTNWRNPIFPKLLTRHCMLRTKYSSFAKVKRSMSQKNYIWFWWATISGKTIKIVKN